MKNLIESIKRDKKQIVITSSANKFKLIAELSKLDGFVPVQVFTPNELNEILNGTIDNEAIVPIVYDSNLFGQEKLNIGLAKIIKNELMNIDSQLNVDPSDELLADLISLKAKLKTEGFIEEQTFRKAIFNDAEVLIYACMLEPTTKQKLNAIENCSVVEIELEQSENASLLIDFPTIDEEVVYVASEICKLIDQGTSIEDICVCVPSDEYFGNITYTFDQFGIKHDLHKEKYLYNFVFVKQFMENLKGIEDLTAELETVELEEDYKLELYKQMVNVFNQYPSYHQNFSKVYEIIIEDLKKTKFRHNQAKGVLRFVDLSSYVPSNNEHVFFMSFVQGKAPSLLKDSRLINDKLANKYSLGTTTDINRKAKANLIMILNHCENLVLTYAHNSKSGEEVVSSIIDEVTHIKGNAKFENTRYSQANDVLALAKAKELKRKYGTKSDRLTKLSSLNLQTKFNNQFKATTTNRSEGLSISPTSIQKFYECEYKFYLDKIMKVRVNADVSINIKIGNLFHDVLEKCLKDEKYDLDYILSVMESHRTLFKTASEQHFFMKYAKHLEQIVNYTSEFHKRSEFKELELEKDYRTVLSEEHEIELVGRIDKVMEFDLGDRTYVCIVDYKTKTKPEIDLKKVEAGLDLQNFLYYYLICKDQGEEFELIGTYQQRVKPLKKMDHPDYIKDFKMFGYTSTSLDGMTKLEPNYKDKDESILANLTFKKDGSDFDRFAKALDKEGFEAIDKIVDTKLSEMLTVIESGQYAINPKVYKKKNISCDYCDYRSICMMEKHNEQAIDPKEKDGD